MVQYVSAILEATWITPSGEQVRLVVEGLGHEALMSWFPRIPDCVRRVDLVGLLVASAATLLGETPQKGGELVPISFHIEAVLVEEGIQQRFEILLFRDDKGFHARPPGSPAKIITLVRDYLTRALPLDRAVDEYSEEER